MNITPNEIDTIEDIGMLNGSPVRIIRTKGGFHIVTGKSNGKKLDEALAAGSHPAIVKFNLEKQYPGFQPNMMKSEASLNAAAVTNHSKYLSEELRKSGHDIYSVQSGANIEFQITKHDVKVGSALAVLSNDYLMIRHEMNVSQEFSGALAGATAEKAISCGAKSVQIQEK